MFICLAFSQQHAAIVSIHCVALAASLPKSQGYVAEKLSILMGAVRSALRRVGLVVHTVDDSLVPPEDRILEPSLQVGSALRCNSG